MLRPLTDFRAGAWLSLAIGLAFVGAVAAIAIRSDSGRVVYTGDDGPIRAVDGRIWEGLAIDAPVTQSWGGLSFPNPNDDPIVLGGIRISPPLGNGFRLLGSQVATDPDRQYAESGPFPGYPSSELGLGTLTGPVEGTVIPAHSERGVALVLGLEITGPGVFWWDRVDVDFRYKGRDYTMRNHLGLYFCAPAAAFPEGCKALFDEHPSEICDRLNYVRLGDNGCVPSDA